MQFYSKGIIQSKNNDTYIIKCNLGTQQIIIEMHDTTRNYEIGAKVVVVSSNDPNNDVEPYFMDETDPMYRRIIENKFY